jgi:hypothetical protein
MREREVPIEATTAGALALPDTSERPVPAVLRLHGFASTMDEVGGMYRLLAKALCRDGIASLRVALEAEGPDDIPAVTEQVQPGGRSGRVSGAAASLASVR